MHEYEKLHQSNWWLDPYYSFVHQDEENKSNMGEDSEYSQ